MGITDKLFPCRACESKDKEISYLRAELSQQNKRLTELARPGTISRVAISERPPGPSKPPVRRALGTFPGDWDDELPGEDIEASDQEGGAA